MASFLDQIKEDHNMWEDMVTQIRSANLHVLVYGNGNSARKIIEKLSSQTEIHGVVVSHAYFQENMTFCGYPVLDSENLHEECNSDTALIFSICPNKDMLAWANALSHVRLVVSYDGQQLLFAPLTIKLIRENEAILSELYESLTDAKSRETMHAYLNCRISGNLDYMSGIMEPNLYFNRDLLTFTDHEIYADCGAYTGDTVARFHTFTSGRYECIHAFEPNKEYHDVLENETKTFHNIQIVKKGLWDHQDVLQFESERGSMSGIDANGMTTVEVDRMDDLLPDSPVSFIKMNIEGAEYNALLGARSLIQRNTPKMAISVYHRPDDLIRIPRLIHDYNPSYRFSLRSHSLGSGLTVLYAQP